MDVILVSAKLILYSYPACIFLLKLNNGNTKKENGWNIFKVNEKDTKITSIT